MPIPEAIFYKDPWGHNDRRQFGTPVSTIEPSGQYNQNEVEYDPLDYKTNMNYEDMLKEELMGNRERLPNNYGSTTRYNQLQNYPENIPTQWDYMWAKSFPIAHYQVPYHTYPSNKEDMAYIENQGYPTLMDMLKSVFGESEGLY